MNLFVVNGHIATITACIVAKSYYTSDENILVQEISRDKVNSNRFSGVTDDYHEISNIIREYFPWNKVIDIDICRTYSFYAKKILISKIPTVRNRTKLTRLKKLKKDIKDKIPKLTSNDNLIVSDNSVVWRFIFRGECDLYMIEHGASMYGRDFILRPLSAYRILKRMLYSFVARYNIYSVPQKVYLTDCGESYTYRRYKNTPISVAIESVYSKNVIHDMFSYFEKRYVQKYPHDYDEICKIKSIMNKHKNRYIYLPTGEVSYNEYYEYLKKQLSEVDTNDSIFLIKQHPKDRGNYVSYFHKNNCESIVINSTKNRYIPVEILLFLLDYPTLVGSYSSSLLYAKWWLNQSPILTEVVSSFCNDILVKEYSATYHDFQEMINKL